MTSMLGLLQFCTFQFSNHLFLGVRLQKIFCSVLPKRVLSGNVFGRNLTRGYGNK